MAWCLHLAKPVFKPLYLSKLFIVGIVTVSLYECLYHSTYACIYCARKTLAFLLVNASLHCLVPNWYKIGTGMVQRFSFLIYKTFIYQKFPPYTIKISCLLKLVIQLLRHTICKLLASSSTTSNGNFKSSAISSRVIFPLSSIRIAVSFLSSVIISSIALHIACMPSLSFL